MFLTKCLIRIYIFAALVREGRHYIIPSKSLQNKKYLSATTGPSCTYIRHVEAKAHHSLSNSHTMLFARPHHWHWFFIPRSSPTPGAASGARTASSASSEARTRLTSRPSSWAPGPSRAAAVVVAPAATATTVAAGVITCAASAVPSVITLPTSRAATARWLPPGCLRGERRNGSPRKVSLVAVWRSEMSLKLGWPEATGR